jgi:hypothetical protein
MQTYKIYQQCTTISADKIKFLSAKDTYFPILCEVLTHPESKLKHLFSTFFNIVMSG